MHQLCAGLDYADILVEYDAPLAQQASSAMQILTERNPTYRRAAPRRVALVERLPLSPQRLAGQPRGREDAHKHSRHPIVVNFAWCQPESCNNLSSSFLLE